MRACVNTIGLQIHKFLWICCFLLVASNPVFAQKSIVKGRVSDGGDLNIIGATVILSHKGDSIKYGAITDTTGVFLIQDIPAGEYNLTIHYLGLENFSDSVKVAAGVTDIGSIKMRDVSIKLNEVNITEKILAIVQKGDTTEYNAKAYKVNPDADAAGLVRKMPGITYDGFNLKAQGEAVLNVYLDGKPFFGDDINATLHNIPVDMISKVQVYNEQTEQEKFTGFKGTETYKSINIITKPDKRNGSFGNAYTGVGANTEGSDVKYLAGASVNTFNGDKRITITGQTNNINIQDYTPEKIIGQAGNGSNVTSKAYGVNYRNKWGEKIEFSGSYFFSQANTIAGSDLHRQYLLADSGQVYNSTRSATNNLNNNRVSMKINYVIDSQNSVIIQPRFSFQNGSGITSDSGITLVNRAEQTAIKTNNSSDHAGYSFSGNILYGHKFKKSGRTLSFDLDLIDNNDRAAIDLVSTNKNAGAPDSSILNQHVANVTGNAKIGGNVTYTERVSTNNMLQAVYNCSYLPSKSQRDNYNYIDSVKRYSASPEASLSNAFLVSSISQKTGLNYLFQRAKYNFSIGMYYEYQLMDGAQEYPVAVNTSRHFNRLLPSASFQYTVDKSSYINVTYNTATSLPSIAQLQNVINNTNPLLLSSGNPELGQSYQQNIVVRYNAGNRRTQTNFSATLTGNYTRNYITSNVITTHADTVISSIVVPKGAQLFFPVNIDGSYSVKGYTGYGIPVKSLKLNFNFNLSGGVSRIPCLINNVKNYQHSKNAGFDFTINSNISENIDFAISSNSTTTQTSNSIDSRMVNLYFSQSNSFNLNLIGLRGFIINTGLNYTYNNGLSTGFTESYFLCSASIGHKLFRNKMGDIRIFIYDVFKQNKNFQHNITQTYIEDITTNALQRYLLATFTYKIRSFRK